MMKTRRPILKPYTDDRIKKARDSLSKRVDTVGQIVSDRPYLSFQAQEGIEHIVREMQNQHQGAAGITDIGGRLAGFLTERDILRKIFGAHGESQAAFDDRHHKLSIYPETLSACDVMEPDPVCLFEDMPVENALNDIKRYGFRFMPVVKRNDKSKLTGIVSERELFWHTQEKTRRMIESQNNLLSYLMHHEAYGCGSDILMDTIQ